MVGPRGGGSSPGAAPSSGGSVSGGGAGRGEVCAASLEASRTTEAAATTRANLIVGSRQRVEQDVLYALYTYLNPLVGGSQDGLGDGWQFGRALNQGELFGVVHAVDGVEFVKILRIYEADIETGKQDAKQSGTHIVLEPDELIASSAHVVKAERRDD